MCCHSNKTVERLLGESVQNRSTVNSYSVPIKIKNKYPYHEEQLIDRKIPRDQGTLCWCHYKIE